MRDRVPILPFLLRGDAEQMPSVIQVRLRGEYAAAACANRPPWR
jgi:hypothetical protein